MMVAIQANFFDYAALDTETRIVVQQRTTEIKALMKRAASDIIEIGQKLIEVKSRLQRGAFDAWAKTEIGMERATAYRFIQVAETFGNSYQIDTIAPSALYLLAAPSTPESARIEAIARAEEGEPISYSTARSIVSDHRSPEIPFVPDEEVDEPLTPYEEQIAARHVNHNDPIAIAEQEFYEDTTAYIEDRIEAQRRQQIATITGSSESSEWYTPLWLIDLVRNSLGGIDLDPASCPAAQATVQAQSYYTAEDDGYTQPWNGRIFLNPPYSKEGEGAAGWARKLVSEYETGHAKAAILLIKAALGYNWFEELWYAYPTCLLRERVTFTSPVDGTTRGPAKYATALIYFGPNVEHFRSVFRPYGRVILPESNDETL